MSSRYPGVHQGALGALFCFLAVQCLAQTGFDTGLAARDLPEQLRPTIDSAVLAGRWLRVRSVADPKKWFATWRTRVALKKMHDRGYRICVMLMPGREQWSKGVRTGGSYRLPLDLRDAYRWAFVLGKAYGDVIDAWEIDNEPDINFVPENAEHYAAYLKACYLGLKAGSANAPDARGQRAVASGEQADYGSVGSGLSSLSPFTFHRSTAAKPPLVLMAPLALPPGPYFETLIANGLFSCTDGINYHYYGFAEDFTGVYRQFEDAINTASRWSRLSVMGDWRGKPEAPITSNPSPNTLGIRQLPVFITEYGYGALSGSARDTVEGRVRQWQWFRDVGKQIDDLQIAAPMAFYFLPYFENGVNEFGLSLLRRDRGLGTKDKGGARTREASSWTAGGLKFRPEDFGVNVAKPWMDYIGRNIGANEASPALAWLLAGAKKTENLHTLSVAAAPLSSVVIDFVAGGSMLAMKQCQGYFLSETADGSSAGWGELRIYNFGSKAVSGRLSVEQFAYSSDAMPETLSVAPGEMRIIPVKLQMTAKDLLPHKWTVRFAEEQWGLTDSVFVTQLYAYASHLSRRVVTELGEADAGSGTAQVLDKRKIAAEESKEENAGRWRVTKGVKVTEHLRAWAFTVSDFPSEPLRPAIAELVLPDGFQMPEGGLLEFEYRLATRTSGDCAPVPEPRAPVQIASVSRELIGVYWRTENGNLYTVWQTPPATNTWQKYAQAKGSFTMGFYGRANLPWRFSDNRPVALVFMFRPNFLPATYEVKNVAITSYVRP